MAGIVEDGVLLEVDERFALKVGIDFWEGYIFWLGGAGRLRQRGRMECSYG